MASPDIVVSPVDGKSDLKAFINLPKRLYAGHKGYIANQYLVIVGCRIRQLHEPNWARTGLNGLGSFEEDGFHRHFARGCWSK